MEMVSGWYCDWVKVKEMASVLVERRYLVRWGSRSVAAYWVLVASAVVVWLVAGWRQFLVGLVGGYFRRVVRKEVGD
jgi:hypothetical protein